MVDVSLEDINGIGKKTLTQLKNANISSVEQLAKMEIHELIKIKGVGKKSAETFIEGAKGLINKNSAIVQKKENEGARMLELEHRMAQLEEQVSHLLSVIDGKKGEASDTIGPIREKKILKDSKPESKKVSFDKNKSSRKKPFPVKVLETEEDIERFLKSLLKPGDSINIDRLVKINELQKISLSMLKKTINELIKEGILEASKGDSKQKLDGMIGKLTRVDE